MALLENGANCDTPILSAWAFSIVLKHVHHNKHTRPFETSCVFSVVRDVVCIWYGVWFT
jgi:hypothetical protein